MIEEHPELDFNHVLFRPQESNLSSRSQVTLQRSFKFRSGVEYTGIPIIASNMDTIGTFEMALALNEHDLFTTIHKHYTPDDWREFLVELNKNSAKDQVLKNIAISTGISQLDQKRVDEIFSIIPDIKFICVDVANGYSAEFVNSIKFFRAKYPDKAIMAGNVVTGEMVKKLIESGADIVKVGIGPGSVCTTRKKAGVGRPQLSAVIECAEAAHSVGGHIISDGGCTVPGDVSKAFGAGADFVMLGGMLAGHDQCSGFLESDANGRLMKLFYGMSSKHAQEKYNAGLATYRASEGKKVSVPYRGDVSKTVLDILGGLRSTCTYTGTAKLEDLHRNTRFFRVYQQTNEVFAGRETES